MNKLQEKLNFLLDKYAVKNSAEISADGKTVKVADKTYALLPWRNERRFIELKKICKNTVGNISHFKTMSLDPKNTDLNAVLKREIDVAEYVSGLKITEIFEARNGNACSVLCATDKNAVITLELAATLPENSQVVDKHEIITDRGTACDRNVDSQTPLSSVYVYGEKHEEYTDVDFELYGLSICEISVVRQAFDIAKDISIGENNNATAKRLDDICNKAALSEKTCENVIL
ncbi:MAG: hypothetical protein J5903_03910 [Clostridia bacterium]|nr:hypothetical protein [Clostridia bacterium]